MSRRARMPPWMRGCSVLTRPSRISGKPVNSPTALTLNPSCSKDALVPPVESRSTPCRISAAARAASPSLSATPNSAREIFTSLMTKSTSPINSWHPPAHRAEQLVGDGLDQARYVVGADRIGAGAAPQYHGIARRRARHVGQVHHRQIHADRSHHRRPQTPDQDLAAMLEAAAVAVG